MSDNTQEKNIFIFDAAEGMVLSQDIMTSTGHLIAAKDTVLTLDMIAKISEYNVLKINVYEEAAAQPEQPEVLEQMTYYEKIKQSQNFEHFNETLIGLAFAILHYKDEISGKGGSGKGGTKEAAATTESTNVASEGEITDDEL